MRKLVNAYLRSPERKRKLVADDFSSLTAVINFNAPSKLTLDLPASSKAQAIVGAKFGLIVSLYDETVSGDLDVIDQSTTGKGRSTLKLQGSDDTAWLDRRIALPCARGGTSGLIYSTSAYYEPTVGPGESVMRELVQFNAITHNPVDGLSLDTDFGRGTDIDINARFQNLLTLMQSCASQAGGLGFRIVQDGTGLKFKVYEPQDRSDTVVFSREYGNLKSYRYVETRPTCNHIIVAGQGEGTARDFVEKEVEDSIAKWGRISDFKDQRNESDIAKLDAAADEALVNGAEKRALSIELADNGKIEYGREFRVGDKVRVLDDRFDIVDVVSQVTLTVKPKSAVSVKPLIGKTADNPNVPSLFRRISATDDRFRNLERG